MEKGPEEGIDASWEKLNQGADSWQMDMEFLKGELNFLNDLVEKFYMNLIEQEHTPDVIQLLSELQKEGEKCLALLEKMKNHIQYMDTIKNSFSRHVQQESGIEFTEVQKKYTDFVTDLKNLKKQLFLLTERAFKN